MRLTKNEPVKRKRVINCDAMLMLARKERKRARLNFERKEDLKGRSAELSFECPSENLLSSSIRKP